jgi:hypothetical protein
MPLYAAGQFDIAATLGLGVYRDKYCFAVNSRSHMRVYALLLGVLINLHSRMFFVERFAIAHVDLRFTYWPVLSAP